MWRASVLLAVALCPVLFGQNTGSQPVVRRATNPTGVTCVSTSPMYLYNSLFYSCQSGTYALYTAGSTTVYPPAGIPNSTGTSYGASYSTSGSGSVLALTNSPVFVTPSLGTPSSAILTNATLLPLSTGVVGNLPVGNLGSGTGASATTFWRGDGTWATPASGLTNPMTTAGDMIIGGTGGAPTRIPGVAGTVRYFLSSSNSSESFALVSPNDVSATASASTTLNMSTYNLTMATTAQILFRNQTSATSTVAQSSPQVRFCGQAWEGSTPGNTEDCWAIQNILANGSNPNPALNFSQVLGSSTSPGLIQMPSIQMTTTFSASGTALPACSTTYKGMQAVVSDATSPTYLGTYTSGGTVYAPVICNGTNWVTH